jgi:heme exporter protein C
LRKFECAMRHWWWKVICALLLGYVVVAGFLLPVPRLDILNETIRNLYFHVPMWFTMIVLFACAFIYSIRYLHTGDLMYDVYAVQFTNTGIFFSIIGMLTGMEWAKFSWGEAWSNDPKELCTALSMLIYFAYAVLRNGMKDDEKRARISAVYNIFAFAMLIPLIFVIPRMTDSLHPGNGGNPAFKQYDLDANMRVVFYPAVVAWILTGVWIASLKIRLGLIKYRKENSFQFDFANNVNNA